MTPIGDSEIFIAHGKCSGLTRLCEEDPVAQHQGRVCRFVPCGDSCGNIFVESL